MNRPRTSLRRARGLTLIELMVALTIGLVITAAGMSLLANDLRENRALIAEARLMQDLRAAADLVTRDLRRAGFWGAAESGVWRPNAGAVPANPYAAIAPLGAASDAVTFRYSRDTLENGAVDVNEQFGYRLRAGVIEAQLGNGNWQAMTDPAAVRIVAFSLTPGVQQIDLGALCEHACPPANASCSPRQQLRGLTLSITGQGVTDASLIRNVRSTARVRSDTLLGACPD